MQIKNVLLGNALFSFSSAILMIVFNTHLQSLFGFDLSWIFITIAVGLLSFVGLILYTVQCQIDNKLWVSTITYMDFSWVLLSILLVIIDPFSLTTTGNIIILGVAGVVGIMAILQFRILKKK